MSDPEMIAAIKEAVTIPVMAKARIGHFVEAQVLEAMGVDYIDESEVCCCFQTTGCGWLHGWGLRVTGAPLCCQGALYRRKQLYVSCNLIHYCRFSGSCLW